MKKIFSALLLLLLMSSGTFAATKADIVFFIDASASMRENIDSVRNNIAAFSRSLVEDQVDVRFAIVSFKDDIDYDTDYRTYLIYLDRTHRVTIHDFGGSIWTSSASDVEAALDSIEADGSDETQTNAMDVIFNWQTFRSDASRFGFLLTDEDTEIDEGDRTFDNEHFVTLNELITKFKNISMPLSVISTTDLREHYLNLFSETGGVFIDITQSDFWKAMLEAANWITEQSNTDVSERLSYTTIEPVPLEVQNDSSILQRIAALANIDVSQINIVTSEIIELSLPREPTEAMRQAVDGEFVAKTDTLTLRSTIGLEDGQPGYYLFAINVPDEVVSMDIKISDLKLYYATPEDFAESAAKVRASELVRVAFDPLTYWEITDMFGFEADTLGKKALVLLLGNTGQSLSMWLVKTLLMLLGGCNAGVVSTVGFGIVGLLGLGGGFVFKKFSRRSKN